jgi:glycosyltransferase involved in cell wall biosynthesis
LALAKAIVKAQPGHDVTVLLNAGMPQAIESLRSDFDGSCNVALWDSLPPTAHVHSENAFRRRASELLRLSAIERLKPDAVHIASLVEGLADNVVATVPARHERYITAATLYDLIPLAHQDLYLSDPRVRHWYMEKIEQITHADALLGISRFSCDEAVELLKIPDERLTDISGAADDIFKPLLNAQAFREDMMHRYGLHRPFVMYAGGFDARKNIASLIRAFAQLHGPVRRAHQLLIVGAAPDSEFASLNRVIKENGLSADEVIFAGYVSDQDLVKLYNLCALYVFPSLQEGFGLPALEAMSSGAIVIGSATSSLPEVIGHPDALFDPRDTRAIAAKMTQVLADPDLRNVLREHGRHHPGKFSWAESAGRAIDAMERARDRLDRPGTVVSIAAISPSHGAIAFVPAPASTREELKSAVVYADADCGVQARYPLDRLQRDRERFARVVIEVADDAYCAKVLLAAKDIEADLVIRDTSIGRGLAAMVQLPQGRDTLVELIYRVGGYQALREALDSEFDADVLGRIITPGDLSVIGLFQLTKDAVDGDAAQSWRSRARDAAVTLVGLDEAKLATDQDWRAIATALSRDMAVGFGRQWLVDISNLFVRDAGTGIQRVVRHVLDELLKAPPQGGRIEPIVLSDDGTFRYARSYCQRRYFPDEVLPPDEIVEFAPGDVYLGLDLAAHLIPAYIDRFRDLRNRGIRQYFVVYDLLPILRPDCFEPRLLPMFRSWYESIAEVADGVMCISHAVADEFRIWLDQSHPDRVRPLQIGYFHLGADLGGTAAPLMETSPDVRLAGLGDRPTFLMVGTIEPRKGHAQVLGAFEQLWEEGIEANLLVIGRPGWLSDELIKRLRKHAERDKHLFWFEEAGDDLLLAAYGRAAALIMASEGEGFGLPLIEAAHHGIPLIARDLPVFREISGENALYFSGYDHQSLATALRDWLALDERHAAPTSSGMHRLTWQQSAAQLVDAIVEKDWVHSWLPSDLRRFAAYDYRFRTDVGSLIRGSMHASGDAGLLLYGMPLAVPAGRHRLTLQGAWNEREGRASICIYRNDGKELIVRRVFEHADTQVQQLVDVEFDLSADVSDLEIRVEVERGTMLQLDAIVLSPLDLAIGVAGD